MRLAFSYRLMLGKLGEVSAEVETKLESMGQRYKLKLQHANRERQRAESEARQSTQAMSSMAARTDAAVAAHAAREQIERKSREEAENKSQQLMLDLEWQKCSQEQVCPCPWLATSIRGFIVQIIVFCTELHLAWIPQVSEVMRAQEKRLADAENLNRSLLVRCKRVEALATDLTAELQKEKRELASIMRRKEGVDSSMGASTELNEYLQGRLDSARRREGKVEEDMVALRSAVEAASSVQVRHWSQLRCKPCHQQLLLGWVGLGWASYVVSTCALTAGSLSIAAMLLLLLLLPQETLSGDLVEAQQEQAELKSQLMRVSQDRDKLATAVSTAHIRYNKQLETMRERLRAYEDENAVSQDLVADVESTKAEMARLEAEVTKLRSELKTSALQARQADAKCQSLTAAHEQQLAAARMEAEKAKASATAAIQNTAILYGCLKL